MDYNLHRTIEMYFLVKIKYKKQLFIFSMVM